jgi:predicted PurR-regulated permease PerM
MQDTNNSLSREDLFLLLESYKNTIELNTTLVEKQNQIIIQNTEVIEQQKKIFESISKMIEKIGQNINDSSIRQNEIITKINENKLNITNEHSSIKNLIYVALIGMGTIVISLTSLYITTFDKFKIIIDIAKHLGVK